MGNDQTLGHLVEQYYRRMGYKLTEPIVKDPLTFKNPLMRFTQEFLHPNETADGFLRVGALLWTTNIRMIWVGVGTSGAFEHPKPTYKEFSYGSIASVQTEKGRLLGSHRITFHIPTNLASGCVEHVSFEATDNYDLVQEFAEHVRKKIAALAHPSTAETQPTNSGDQLIMQLERLANLRSQGSITDDEFNVAKRKLLEI
jgi:hypothetical protein